MFSFRFRLRSDIISAAAISIKYLEMTRMAVYEIALGLHRLIGPFDNKCLDAPKKEYQHRERAPKQSGNTTVSGG